MHKREEERKNKNKKVEEENKMKYKTLIEKNSEPILTEGRLTPPPPPPHTPALQAPLSSPRFPLLPNRQSCIYAGQEDRGEREKNACAENTIEACGTKTCEWVSSCLVVARALSAVAW